MSVHDGLFGLTLARAIFRATQGFALVNAATFYMYIARPFAWQDGSVARFMW